MLSTRRNSALRFVPRIPLLSIQLLVMAVTLLAVTPSRASWSSFKSTGSTTGIGNPSCAQLSNDHAVCAVESEKAAMMVNEYNGSSWGTWKSLTGAISSNPSCTSDGDSRVFCAATAASGSMEVAIYSGSSWGTPSDVSGTLYSAPSCAEYKSGEVLCVARNSSGTVSWSLYDDGKWSSFASLGATAISAPDCTSDHDSGVVCSFYTLSGETLVNKFVSGAWKGFINIGGLGGGTPDCTYWKPTGQVACFAKATNDGVYVSTFNGGSWSTSDWTGYSNLGGVANDNASCTSQTSGELVCGVIAAENSNDFYANVYNGSEWSGWNKVSGDQGIGSPSCVPLTTGKALCLVMGLKNQLSSVVGP